MSFYSEDCAPQIRKFNQDDSYFRIEKIKQTIGEETIEEMDAMAEDDLRRVIVNAQSRYAAGERRIRSKSTVSARKTGDKRFVCWEARN